jgi:hypothetical protein
MTKIENYFESVVLKLIKTKEHFDAFVSNPDVQKKFNENEIEELREMFIDHMFNDDEDDEEFVEYVFEEDDDFEDDDFEDDDFEDDDVEEDEDE